MELNFLLVEHGWGHDEPGDWADPRHEEGGGGAWCRSSGGRISRIHGGRSVRWAVPRRIPAGVPTINTEDYSREWWKCHYWTFQAFQENKNLPTIVTNSSLVISTLNFIWSKFSCLITPRSCDTNIFY